MKMKLKETVEMVETCQLTQLWSCKMEHAFNVVCIGQIFRKKNKVLVVGHEDGIARVYSLPAPGLVSHSTTLQVEDVLETKGGPIQAMVVHDVTKLNNNDITVADSRGMVTVFSNGQIIARKAASEHCIQCLNIQHDSLGLNAIIAGDREGHVMAFSPFTEHWRLRLTDIRHYKSMLVTPHVSCVHVTELTDCRGQHRSYVLVADTCKNVHLINGGSIVLTLHTPGVITAMASGRFIETELLGASDDNLKALEKQVVMGTDTGAIYILANFQVYEEEVSNIRHTITSLHTLPACDTQSTDTLLCAGHLNALCVIRHRQEVTRYRTASWVTSLVATDVNNDGVDEIVIGCHDNTIQALKIQFS